MRCFVLACLVSTACTTNNPPPASPDATPPAACSDLTGTWAVDGTCGADVCAISQAGCTTHVSCSAGAASYAGSVSGTMFQYSGTTAQGVPASCSGSVAGSSLTATCTVQGATCTVTGARR